MGSCEGASADYTALKEAAPEDKKVLEGLARAGKCQALQKQIAEVRKKKNPAQLKTLLDAALDISHAR